MDEQNPFLKTISQARTLFQTEFQPIEDSLDEKQRLLRLKINGQYKNVVQKIKLDHEKRTFAKDTIQQKKTLGQGEKMPEQIRHVHEQKELDPVQKLIKNMIFPSNDDKNVIKSFQKYDKNIGEYESQNKQAGSSLVVSKNIEMNLAESTKLGTIRSSSLRKLIKPKWHPPFKLYRVIVGHHGWVRCIAISPQNTFFATGSADRTIKFWDLASGELKISLTGHVNTVRALEFSKVHPYLFSCGEDKSVKCWDLEMNKVIRNYHGHLSGVYSLKIHNGLSVLVTGGRDSAVRVWDIRVRRQVHCLAGHAHTVGSLVTQEHEPHIVSGSFDSFVKLWDVGMGKCVKTLTNHKKAVRAMVENPFEYTFATAASDNIKVWKCPEGQFLRNISGHDSIIDAMAVNQDGVLVSGGDDGTMRFWDWSSGYNFQDFVSKPQPGSIAAESGIFALQFDRSGSRLLSGQCDKTIKMYKEDETATEENHPIKSFQMEFDKK